MKKHQTTMELNLTVEYVHVIEIRGLGIKDFLIDVIRSCRGCLCFPSYIQLFLSRIRLKIFVKYLNKINNKISNKTNKANGNSHK